MNVQKAPLQNADYCPPPPEGDFYRITDITDESERTVLKRVRDFHGSRSRTDHRGLLGARSVPLRPRAQDRGTRDRRREGASWVLNGEKKWIGNATFADINIIWAREESSGQVKGFVVAKDNPGFAVKKIEHKMALRVVQNGLITLKDCRVPEADRLQNANSFRDTANVPRMTRAGVAWFAVGCGRGAYEHALRYATQRMQFGKPIAGFQLVQDLLVRMLGNVTATQCLMLRLGQLQTQGLMTDEQASLAKAFCTVKCRETVGYARELLGGNGILLENHIGRFVADAEAIYSYEGTREMNTLIVGKAITGLSAFV